MYQFSYAEIMADNVADAKDRERQVLDKAVRLLQSARNCGRSSREAVEALYYTRRVWLSFIEDLRQPENQLDVDLRANLISIGIWILKETEKIRTRESDNFEGVIDVITIIRDGLK